jgi:hypothetical protein
VAAVFRGGLEAASGHSRCDSGRHHLRGCITPICIGHSRYRAVPPFGSPAGGRAQKSSRPRTNNDT